LMQNFKKFGKNSFKNIKGSRCFSNLLGKNSTKISLKMKQLESSSNLNKLVSTRNTSSRMNIIVSLVESHNSYNLLFASDDDDDDI